MPDDITYPPEMLPIAGGDAVVIIELDETVLEIIEDA